MFKRLLSLCFLQHHQDVVNIGVRTVVLCPSFVYTMVPNGIMSDLIEKVEIMSWYFTTVSLLRNEAILWKPSLRKELKTCVLIIITYQVKFKNSLHTSYYTCGNTKRVSSYAGGKMSYFISIDDLQNVGSYNLCTMFQT